MKIMKQSYFWAILIWFVLSVLFLGTPSPLLVLLPGIFIVDAMVSYDTAGTIPVIYIFGSVLNLFIYLFVGKGIGKLFGKKKK